MLSSSRKRLLAVVRAYDVEQRYRWLYSMLHMLVDRTSKPMIALRQQGEDYDAVDGFSGEDENLVTGEEQLNELENVRCVLITL